MKESLDGDVRVLDLPLGALEHVSESDGPVVGAWYRLGIMRRPDPTHWVSTGPWSSDHAVDITIEG